MSQQLFIKHFKPSLVHARPTVVNRALETDYYVSRVAETAARKPKIDHRKHTERHTPEKLATVAAVIRKFGISVARREHGRSLADWVDGEMDLGRYGGR